MKIKILKEAADKTLELEPIGHSAEETWQDDEESEATAKLPPKETTPTASSPEAVLASKGFENIKRLGSGMVGNVYSADWHSGLEVAVKVVPKGAISTPLPNGGTFRWSGEKEIRAYEGIKKARSQSKHIEKHFPEVFAIMPGGDNYYIFMERLTDEGPYTSVIDELFAGVESLVDPGKDLIDQGAYKDPSRRLFMYIKNDKSRNILLDRILSNISPEARTEAKEWANNWYKWVGADKVTQPMSYEMIDELFAGDGKGQDVFLDGFGNLQKEFEDNSWMSFVILKILEVVKRHDPQGFYMNATDIARQWVDLGRKGAPIGWYHRPPTRKAAFGGEEDDIASVYKEAESIKLALDDLESIMGLVGTDMHDKNVMMRPMTGDIVIVDVGLFKPRKELNEIYGWSPGADEGSSEGHAEFKKQLKNQLVGYYQKDPEAGFLGYINRKVARILKQVWNETVDRGFIDSVNKVHYMPIGKLARFLMGAGGKDEISTVGWHPSEDYKQDPGFPVKTWVGVRLEGWTSFAGNTNLYSGRAPIPGEKKKYKHSGVPKWADSPMSMVSYFSNALLHMNLTNLIRLVANNAVLDGESFKSTAKRKKENSGILAHLLGMKQSKHNEFVLDNWKVVEIVDFKGMWHPDEKVLGKGNGRLIDNLSKKFNIPIASVSGINEEKQKDIGSEIGHQKRKGKPYKQAVAIALSKHKIGEALYEIQFDRSKLTVKNRLNPKIWDKKQMDSEIREKLLEIARDFEKDSHIEGKVENITLTGGNASYNWHNRSDLDVHLVVDFKRFGQDAEFIKDIMNLERIQWNKNHNVLIHGHEIEIYVQDKHEDHYSSGIFSLEGNNWVEEPLPSEADYDYNAILKKAETLAGDIKAVKELYDEEDYKSAHKQAEKLKEKIRNMRSAGLEKDGLWSTENVAFKLLRNSGYLDRLGELYGNSYDNMMSLGGKSTITIRILSDIDEAWATKSSNKGKGGAGFGSLAKPEYMISMDMAGKASEAVKNGVELHGWDKYGQLVAEAYEKAPKETPEAVEAFKQLGHHVLKNFKKVQSVYPVDFVDGQPYDSAAEMAKDINMTGIMKISKDFNQSEVFGEVENLYFRAVHDYYGHLKAQGHEKSPEKITRFNLEGELKAYNHHLMMLRGSEMAKAVFTEVIGQACYFMYHGNFPDQKVFFLNGFDHENLGRVDGYEIQDGDLVQAVKEKKTGNDKYHWDVSSWHYDGGYGDKGPNAKWTKVKS
jgi:hypothetical protein